MTDSSHVSQPSTTSDVSVTSVALRVVMQGKVQGLGIRPSVLLLAREMQLAGVVRNTSRGVEIEVEGPEPQLGEFVRRLPGSMPNGSVIESLESCSCEAAGRVDFTIERHPSDGPITARVPQDLAICVRCAQEIVDPQQRRYRYPFTSCTACGPRYAIVGAMPYEREDTTMAEFEFCELCRTEYELPGDRRLHAQTNACPACGPEVWCVDSQQREIGRGESALQAAAEALRSGQIVALRGLGGYQLLVDATNEEAVRRLRQRKRRRAKPLAVMVASLQAAEHWAVLEQAERQALVDPENPIVLVKSRVDAPLADSVSMQLDTVGLMLPTTPLHALLMRDTPRPLVCTSGNCDGDPLQYEIDGAQQRLADVGDVFLHHNRPIARPVDDSVVRVIAGRSVTIRLARGIAPLPLELPTDRSTLALGGYLKSAAAWCNGRQAVLGPHIGDQESVAARERYLQQCQEWRDLYRFEPELLAHDMHPEYFTTQWAIQQPNRCVAVQHHHAHVVSAMVEHRWLDRTVLGVSWDGTGYGPDGVIWGGEFLLATVSGFERFACLRPFHLPGGEAAVFEPWRTALALVQETLGAAASQRFEMNEVDATRRAMVLQILKRPQFSPKTTSAGRLFDAVASLALNIARVDFDGQAPMLLEAIADRDAAGQYDFPLREGKVLELDWRPLIAEILRDRESGVAPGAISMRFHRTAAAAIADVCRRRRDLPVVLGGGVFQNRLLTELLLEMLGDETKALGLPGLIPPNDGGLAVGQLAVALAANMKF